MKEEKAIELTIEQLGEVAGGAGTEEKIFQVVADYLDLNLSQIAGSSSLTRDLGADSYDFLDIIQKLEEVFSIKIPEREYRRFLTVNDLIEYIKMHI